ncbi:MAG: hypothetical protein NTU79_01155 [Planctomycetota bacterium]|jgi:hypothetical protein|nr:hypothetical protein [Planctomycetota bacterium]
MSNEEAKLRLLAEDREAGDCISPQEAEAIRWAVAELDRRRDQINLLREVHTPELVRLLADCIEHANKGFDVLSSLPWERIVQWWNKHGV